MRPVLVAFACIWLAIPASAQQLVKEIMPSPPRGDRLEARLATATIQPGGASKWHSYPNHSIVYVAEGTFTLEFREGEPKVYNAGEGFIEPVNTVLRGANKGVTPVKLVIFQLSPPELPTAIDAPSQ